MENEEIIQLLREIRDLQEKGMQRQKVIQKAMMLGLLVLMLILIAVIVIPVTYTH